MASSSAFRISVASASPDEAAAVVAAIEQFVRQTAPAPVADGPKISNWHRAALHEGVGRVGESPDAWGDPHPWAP